MKIWLDAQLSPALARWMEDEFDVENVFSVQLDERLRAAKDGEIFAQAKEADAVVMTKDRDFVDLVEGVRHVLVNGVFVLEDGAMTGALPGRFLERRRRARE